jgi:hypothetical protein
MLERFQSSQSLGTYINVIIVLLIMYSCELDIDDGCDGNRPLHVGTTVAKTSKSTSSTTIMFRVDVEAECNKKSLQKMDTVFNQTIKIAERQMFDNSTTCISTIL